MLPFSRNKILTARYTTWSGQYQQVSYDEIVFIPVLNQLSSSHRYYAIKPHGSLKGLNGNMSSSNGDR
ncbi:unnamed protein product [Lactuca virosa]|uniref:Uncharacterized protein n=1 Tax=Lactuca virosa TaxID=75947 RepID=A0AAU9LY90_9ASTR|nr:unnamed protein product [Lactuca virosa]